jgi:leucine dehydrogenase
MFTHLGYENHEKVIIFNRMGGLLKGFIAIHNTALGPALGGCRMMDYASPNDALSDALKLSHGMTYKNCMAGIPFGGGKAVIQTPKQPFNRRDLFREFGRVVRELNGEYNTAIDVGTTLQDVKYVEETTEYVCGTRNTIAGTTGLGAYEAILGLFDHTGHNMANRTFIIQGLGQTGFALARRLSELNGAVIIACDPDEEKCIKAKLEFGAQIVPPEQIYDQLGDVFVPCALGGVINENTIKRLTVWGICGTANNQLDGSQEDLWSLIDRNIWYVPDFVANAGGVMHASQQLLTRVMGGNDLVDIGDRAFDILEQSSKTGLTTSTIAYNMVDTRINTNNTNGNW